MASRFVHNHAPLGISAFVFGIKILFRYLAGNKVRLRSVWTDQTWRMRALSESDPRRLQRAQYQSNWKRITALASHSRVKRFYGRQSILDFSSSQHPGLPRSSSTHSRREQGIVQKSFRITNVCSTLPFLLCDDNRWYFNQMAFHRFSIPRKRGRF